LKPPLDWARAHGEPVFAGRIRTSPAAFVVDERLDIEFSGEGEHDWLRIEKTGANTHWVAERLARYAGVRAADVGYAGRKDRHAVTTQWFSVRRQIRQPTDWNGFALDGVRIVDRRVHSRKLQRGAHRGNDFRIAIRGDCLAGQEERIAERLQRIAAAGVPNYFGEQRFGRDAANVELGQAVLAGRRMPRNKRSIGISAVRAWQFNEALDARVRAGTWDRLEEGDRANLDGSNSSFVVEEVTEELLRRCRVMDVHPTGALQAIDSLGVSAATRSLRARVADLGWRIDGDVLGLQFGLGPGSYATAVLREIVRVDDAAECDNPDTDE